jgi:hypothetical protein
MCPILYKFSFYLYSMGPILYKVSFLYGPHYSIKFPFSFSLWAPLLYKISFFLSLYGAWGAHYYFANIIDFYYEMGNVVRIIRSFYYNSNFPPVGVALQRQSFEVLRNLCLYSFLYGMFSFLVGNTVS